MHSRYRKVKHYIKLLSEQIVTERAPIEGIEICKCGYKSGHTPPPLSDFRPFGKNDRWGEEYDSHAWFHMTASPTIKDGYKTRLYFHTDIRGWDATNPQFICYVNGVLIQGLDTNHTYIDISDNTPLDIYLYAYVGTETKSRLLVADIALVNPEVEKLFYDLNVPFETLSYLDEGSKEYMEILIHLHKAVSLIDLMYPGSESYFESIGQALAYMDEEFYGKYCSPSSPKTVCIGHTHIDCAWRWTLRQTREKVQRSFSTVLALMDKYPEYKFMSSQALLYKYLKEEAPELYAKVKERIKEGRWECEGGMWVEADCNLSSGESLVRQVLYGKRFFKEEFGVDNKILWLPDVFGYSAALPQILRKSGIDWFVTSKISWNDTNTMPYDTFMWYGLDGTPIRTHFLTATDKTKGPYPRITTYVGMTRPSMLTGTYGNYKEKYLNDEAILTFGYGDGGGGPTPEHIEVFRREAKGIPGTPTAVMDFATDYLGRLGEKIENNPYLPNWRGELYLEFHRGTYTSISKNKRNNRKSEFLYMNAELSATMAKYLLGAGYDKAALHCGWEDILTNQFHDIIPGSSIKEVYDDSDIDYAKIKSIGEKVDTGAKEAIAAAISADAGYVVFNPHGFTASGLVKAANKYFKVENIPAKGYRTVKLTESSHGVKVNGKAFETDALVVTFDDAWQISSIYDKENEREIIAAGKVGNELRIYPDFPDEYDAWEWQEYSKDSYETLTALEGVELIDEGARLGIKLTRPFGKSKITQTVYISGDSRRIDFETTADWHEIHKMVKATFPTDLNALYATYDVQFGSVERPTHTNTSWDKAKFEVCAHKYADLSEGNYGVTVMNDCKYGHDIHNGEISLSLFKCATSPNPVADQEIIDFTYSLYPHSGALKDSDAIKEAYILNNPLCAIPACGKKSSIPEEYSFVSCDKSGVIVETVKEAEDSSATIVRLYDSSNTKSRATLTFAHPFGKCSLCNLLEEEERELPIKDGKVTVDVGAFEIITLKLS